MSRNNTIPPLRYAVALVATAVAVLTAGCGGGPAVSDDVSFDTKIEDALAEAKSGGASVHQIEVLESAQESGGVTLLDVRQSAYAALTCMESAGLRAEYDEREKSSGLVVPGYLVALSEPASAIDAGEDEEMLAEQCDTSEYYWVSKVYQTQPTSVAEQEQVIEERSPEIRLCLEEAGHPVSPDASASEIDQQSISVLTESEGAVDCVIGSGL